MNVVRPEFRALEKQVDLEVTEHLEKLMERALDGEVTGLAWAINTPDGVQTGHTTMADGIQMLGMISRMQHWLNQALDENAK